MSPSLRATSEVIARPDSTCAPMTTGSRRAPRLSTFETATCSTPRARRAASVPDDRIASSRSPWPGAYGDGRPSSSKSSPVLGEPERDALGEPERLGHAERGDVRARLLVRGKLVISATGISTPSASPSRAVSPSFHERKLRPSSASTTPLTTPPNRVAIPPASTTCATRPAASASTRPSRATCQSPEPGLGQRHDVVARRGGSTDAVDDVRRGRQLAVGDPCTQRLEQRRVEAVPLEQLLASPRRASSTIIARPRRLARQGLAYGARWTPRSVTIAATSAAGVTSNAGFRAGNRVVTSAGSRSSIGISAPVAQRRVERRGRRDDDERQPVVRREHGEPVRADLVRGVAVRRDPVGAGDDEVDLAPRHERRGCSVGDHRVRDAELLELPGGQPAPLEERSRLVDPDVLDETRLAGGPDRAERRCRSRPSRARPRCSA